MGSKVCFLENKKKKNKTKKDEEKPELGQAHTRAGVYGAR
jgi:hypothetical protein